MKDKIADVLGIKTSVDAVFVASKHLTINNDNVSIVVEMLHSNTLLIKRLSDYHLYEIISILVNASTEEPLLKQISNNADLIIPKVSTMQHELNFSAATTEIEAVETVSEVSESQVEIEETEDDDEVSAEVLEIFEQIKELDLDIHDLLELIHQINILVQKKVHELQDQE
jgi:hypothetical protein